MNQQEIEAAMEGIHLGQSNHSNGNIKPHFFSIIADPSFQLHRLRLPPKFSQEHGSSLLAHAFLMAPEGQEHKVEVTTERDGHIWFTHGWHDFATAYSLDFGSFLVFRYEGNSHFHVFIFSTSCSEIDYESFAIDEDSEEENGTDKDESFTVDEDDESYNEGEDEHNESDGDDSYSNQGEHETVDPLQRARAFESDNPSFIVKMQESYLRGRYIVLVPYSYSKVHMASYMNNKGIQLQLEVEPNGKTWRVNVLTECVPTRKTFKAKLSGGWKRFAIENGLSVGDACVFELIHKEAHAYRVHIFRGKQLSDIDDDEDGDDDEDYTDINQGRIRAKQQARAFNSGNPSFLVIMRETYLTGDFRLWVPAWHAKRYLLGAETNVLLLEPAEKDGDETWAVNFIIEPARRGRVTVVRITAGWKDFSDDNGLRVGDACVFELIDRSSMTYCVHIYRAIPAAP